MKNLLIKLSLVLFSLCLFNDTMHGKDKKSKNITTVTIHVAGNCNMCKKRIENAAYIDGVKRAEWDKQSGHLTITFDKRKTNLEEISQSIANVGHDTDSDKATDNTVKSLPACCNYRENGIHVH